MPGWRLNGGFLLHGTRQNVIAAEQAAHYFAIVSARPAWRIFSPDIPVDSLVHHAVSRM